MITGAQAVVRCLESAGVTHMLGIAGHTVLPLLNEIVDSPIKYVNFRHEQVAAHAADGYYRVSHRPAVVLTTLGPGLTNTVTGMAEAALDTSAIVMITGDTPTEYAGYESFQEIAEKADTDQLSILRPVVKRAWKAQHVTNLPQMMARALNVATTGRPGPVVVDIPMDLFTEQADMSIPEMSRRMVTTRRVLGDPEEVERAVRMLYEAERPLIYAGTGVSLAEASDELRALAERLDVPVVTSLNGHGAIDESHPLALGFTGTVGTPPANEAARTADVILALGTRFWEMDCSSWKRDYFFRIPPARLIQIDIEANEIGKIYPVEIGMVADARSVLGQMLEVTRGFPKAKERPWLQDLQTKMGTWRAEIEVAQASSEMPTRQERIMRDIRDALPDDGIAVSDVGMRHMAGQHFQTRRCSSHLVTTGLGTMGFATPAALGAKLAAPHRPVVAITGDGGFSTISQSLATAVEYDLGVVWVVLNNCAYGMVAVPQRHNYGREIGTRFVRESTGEPYNPDFAKLAQAYGAEGQKIENPSALRPALERALASGRPTVLDVICDQRPKGRGTGYWDAGRYMKVRG